MLHFSSLRSCHFIVMIFINLKYLWHVLYHRSDLSNLETHTNAHLISRINRYLQPVGQYYCVQYPNFELVSPCKFLLYVPLLMLSQRNPSTRRVFLELVLKKIKIKKMLVEGGGWGSLRLFLFPLNIWFIANLSWGLHRKNWLQEKFMNCYCNCISDDCLQCLKQHESVGKNLSQQLHWKI